MVEGSTAALRVACSVPAWSKYLYDLHLVAPGPTASFEKKMVMFLYASTTQE